LPGRLESTGDPAHGKQEEVAYYGHFAKNCFHPRFGFTSDGDCLGAKLRPGKVHSADGVLDFIKPLVERYPACFKLFWFRADAAFANPETMRIARKSGSLISSSCQAIPAWSASWHLTAVARWADRLRAASSVDLYYQGHSWRCYRRVVAKIEWHRGELFPRIGFVVTNSRLPAGKGVKVYNGGAEIENRIKEGKNTLRWDKTSCQRVEANQARLKMGILAYHLLHMIRQFYVWGEEVRRSMDWLSKRLIKVGARISYQARRWYVHVASAFPLAHHYRAVLAWDS
jgi:hypothetical protein